MCLELLQIYNVVMADGNRFSSDKSLWTATDQALCNLRETTKK